jgi:hypothetical protein
MGMETLKQYGKSDLEGMGLDEVDALALLRAVWKEPEPIEPAVMIEMYLLRGIYACNYAPKPGVN